MLSCISVFDYVKIKVNILVVTMFFLNNVVFLNLMMFLMWFN